jgi:hypothetical protein
MNGELAQIIAVVAYGNLFLLGGEAAKVDPSSNSTFQYVASIMFSRYKTNQDTEGLTIASSVPEWFDFLRSSKVTRFRMGTAGYA